LVVYIYLIVCISFISSYLVIMALLICSCFICCCICICTCICKFPCFWSSSACRFFSNSASCLRFLFCSSSNFFAFSSSMTDTSISSSLSAKVNSSPFFALLVFFTGDRETSDISFCLLLHFLDLDLVLFRLFVFVESSFEVKIDALLLAIDSLSFSFIPI
jgi:hypothetical protein